MKKTVHGSKFCDNKMRAIYNKTGGFCWYCGSDLGTPNFMLEERDPNTKFSVDHQVPKSQNGTNEMDNLVPCCKSCNSSKRGKSLEEYRLWKTWTANARCAPFTHEQIEWLKRNGISLPELKPFVFWFESVQVES